ncbi:MAG: hypothetical protein KIT83_06515 [Bryobacterales bacterium]|nr:hypothetical protein [Bryobacterales bacterium]
MDWLLLALLAILLTVLLAGGWYAIGAHTAKMESDRIAGQLWAGRVARTHRAGETLFYETQVAELPEVVRRYFQWTFDDGTPIAHAARILMTGRIRLGRGKPWMPHHSEEVIRAEEGFLWTANVSGSLPISGSDSFVDGQGAMQWRLLGLLPVMTAANANITRAARWRFVAEYVFVPGALLPSERVRWEAVGDHNARVTIFHDGIAHSLHFDFDLEGMPRKVSFERWGDFESEGGIWQPIPYAVRCHGVFRKGGYSLPRQYTACWWADTDKELAVVELEIEDADFQ